MDNVRLDQRLIRGKSIEEQDEIQVHFSQSRFIREIIIGVLDSEIQTSRTTTDSPDFLTAPNLLERYGYQAGLRMGLEAAKKILT